MIADGLMLAVSNCQPNPFANEDKEPRFCQRLNIFFMRRNGDVTQHLAPDKAGLYFLGLCLGQG